MKRFIVLSLLCVSSFLSGYAAMIDGVKYRDTVRIMRVTHVTPCSTRQNTLNKYMFDKITEEQCERLYIYYVTDRGETLLSEFTSLTYVMSFMMSERNELAKPGDLVAFSFQASAPRRLLRLLF